MDLFKIREYLSEGKTIYELPLRVTFYSRVSTEHEEQKSSLKNQVDYFEEMIKSNTRWIYHTGYVDEGISGTVDTKRYNFMNMIRDAKNGLFDLILTKEISRFSRNTLDSIKYTRELLTYGVAVYFVSDNINTSLLDSELRLTIMASLAQDEVRRLSERVKFGMKRSIKNGHILGNDLLYGYDKNKVNNSLVINKDESIVVKRLFTLYGINKLSLHAIAKLFNEDKIESSLGKKWNVTTLSRMIRNPKYKGYYCGGKSEVVDYMSKRICKFDESEWVMYEDKVRIPPIVDEYLFDLANSRLNECSKDKHKIIKYSLSGKLYCVSCGNILYKRKMSKNKDEVVWFCKNKCCKTNIRWSELCSIIKSIFKGSYKHVSDLLFSNYKKIDARKEKERYDLEIKSILDKKNKILELNLDGCLSNLEFKVKNEEYNKLLNNLDKKLNNLKEDNLMVQKKEIIKTYLRQDEFIDKLINLAINRMDIEYIDLENVCINIKTNLVDMPKDKYMFSFKRGFDVIGTRRYLFNVIVYIN